MLQGDVVQQLEYVAVVCAPEEAVYKQMSEGFRLTSLSRFSKVNEMLQYTVKYTGQKTVFCPL